MSATVDISPYKGLAPFEDSELDALLFFGREREVEIVAMNLLASRLTILYGPSGVGKSSLLRAGVARGVRGLAPDAHVVIFGSWREDPVQALRAELAPDAGTEAMLADALAASGRELYLILDQFEEYFLYHGDARGHGTLVDQLPELLNRGDAPVNVLIGIREDALARLDVFKPRLPRVFGNFLRLDHLDREAARAAVLGPLERHNELTREAWAAEPAFVEAVLDEVAAGRIEAARAGAAIVPRGRRKRVEAPYLQLVLQRMWDVERADGSQTLRLETLQRLGGAEQIVEDHLERAMAALTVSQQAAAAAVFGQLVTPSGTKIAHRLSDLATYAAVGAGELEPILESLAHERIVRPLRDGTNGDGGYEIYHDVLAAAVLQWRRRHEARRQLESERARARRRSRRMVGALAIVLAALAATTAVAAYALTQRREAREQATLAQQQRLVAERQTDLAQRRAGEARENLADAERARNRAAPDGRGPGGRAGARRGERRSSSA